MYMRFSNTGWWCSKVDAVGLKDVSQDASVDLLTCLELAVDELVIDRDLESACRAQSCLHLCEQEECTNGVHELVLVESFDELWHGAANGLEDCLAEQDSRHDDVEDYLHDVRHE